MLSNTRDLTGRVALVTGGSRGIGRAVSLALAEAGADIGVNYLSREREAEEVRALVERYGRRCITVRADVSVATDVSRMVKSVEEELGGVTILVNNAGIARPRGLDEITEEDWDTTIDVNLKSVFLVTQAVLPNMRAGRWGRIINISSTAIQTRRNRRPALHCVESGYLGIDSLVCFSIDRGRHHGECDRAGLDRNGDARR